MNRRVVAAIGASMIFALSVLAIVWYRPSAMHAVSPIPRDAETSAPIEPPPQYIEVLVGCGPSFAGPCVNMRSGPGTEYPIVTKLRAGVVLKVSTSTVASDGSKWHKVLSDDWVRYPERVNGDWFVAEEYVHLFTDIGVQNWQPDTSTSTTKRIIVDRSEQILYAYENDVLFMQEPISTGLELTPTPRGTFTVFRKTPSRYMQGPIPDISDQYYDLPGVPWNLYFTEQGGAIHGAYWHVNFGQPWSHGCVNLPPQKAKELYQWADIGTVVIVRD